MVDNVTGAWTDLVVTVDLPRQQIWDLITDVPRFGEWSPECEYAAWLDTAAPGPRIGARFVGRNRYPNGQVGTVTCVVIEAERPQTFAWVVLDDRGDLDRPSSTWRYELLPGSNPDRTLVRHRFEHGPGESGARAAARRDPAALAVRLAQLRRNMAVTLAAMTQPGVGRSEPTGSAVA